MYAWCQDMPGVTADDYASVIAELGGAEKQAPGLIVHVAGPVEGGFRVVDVWETQEDAERFAKQHLARAVGRAHGDDVSEMQSGFRTLTVVG